MDLLNRIRMDIARVDSDIREIDVVMNDVPKEDYDTFNKMLSLKSRYRNDKIKLLNSYHTANQDLDVRNELILARIEELRERVASSRELRGELSKLDLLVDFLKEEALAYEDEEGDEGYDG